MKGLIWQDDENIIDVVYQTIYGLPIKEAIHVVKLYQEKQLIPIEWILNKYRGKWEKAEMGRRDFQFIEVIDELLADWGKENEGKTD